MAGRERRSVSIESTCTAGREDEIQDSIFVFEDDVVDLTYEESAANDLVQDGELPMRRFQTASGSIIKPDDLIEVHHTTMGSYNIQFVKVKIIVQDRSRHFRLRGIPFVRTRNLLGMLPKKLNEVCMILHINRYGQDVESTPLLVEVRPESIVRKRTLVVTNATFPHHSFDMSALQAHTQNKDRQRHRAERLGALFCRWKLKIYFTVQDRKLKRDEQVIERVKGQDASESRYRISEDALCNQWRGGRIKGGSWCPVAGSNMTVNVDMGNGPQVTTSLKRGPRQKYTLFDSFSGAGGVSRGAQSAGFKIQYAVDKAPDVWETYKANFSDAELFQESIDGFIQASQGRRLRTDVLHLSPPCQYFSPAHTREAAHDDENIFSLFGCNELINKIRPRLITVEQTFGIVRDRHRLYLQTLIGDFTQFGYSVRWKVVRLCTWGSAQDRKRLIMIAAAPGEVLPPFPYATHSERGVGGLEPFTTIRRAIGGIRRGDDLHDLRDTKHYNPRKPPLDADRLSGTITTGGSEAYYPDGTRDYTLREYACLQGFPKHHRFIGNKTRVKKQIGNAFPPNTVQVLYKHLEEWMLKEDGMTLDRGSADNFVIIDDDDSDASTNARHSSYPKSSPEMDDIIEISPEWQTRRGNNMHNFIDLT